jgi:glucosamine--fructose-6-phosphate aminotransferase (isomerizing)
MNVSQKGERPTVSSTTELREAIARTTAWQEASTGDRAIRAALEVAREAPAPLLDRLVGADHIVIAGAGSSYYIAQVAAAAMRARCGLPAVAVPLSEVLLRPEGVFGSAPAERQPVVVISRSGTTTEALDLIGLARGRGQTTIAVTCRPASAMAQAADHTLAVPEADEAAIVMTRSFAAQAALLMRLGARAVEGLDGYPRADRFAADLDAVPGRWGEVEPHIEHALHAALADPSRIVVLGGGAAVGVAHEAVLKLTETSQVAASAFHPLEFRHGPISVCEPGVLVIGILGGAAEAAERRVLEETAALGASTWALGPTGPGADLDEIARLPLVLHALQALALAVALRRGRDPESPRHLSQVVVIDEA